MKKLILVFAALCAVAGAQTPAWKFGSAKAVITPKEPIWMAGFGVRTKPMEGVRHDIYVKALALTDEAGKTSVVVTSDLLGFTGDMSAAISAKCREKYGLTRDRLILSASHTHSGPVVGRMLWPAYPIGPAEQKVIDRYTGWLVDTTIDTIGRSMKEMQPASLAFSQGLAGFAVNRRRLGNRALPGPVEHDVPVLTVRDASGALKVVLFQYACHNTSLSDNLISGDWAGFAQIEVEKANAGSTAMYMDGCGADANPLPRDGEDLSQMYGKILAKAIGQVLAGKMKPVQGRLSTAFETVDLPFATPPTKPELEARLKKPDSDMNHRHAQLLLTKLEKEGHLPSKYPYPVQVWQFGRDLKMIVLGGEVVVDYSIRLRNQYGWADTWVAAYSNDVFAYIPSERVLKEGGYEGGGAMIPYGQPGPFAPGVEEIIVRKVGEVNGRVK